MNNIKVGDMILVTCNDWFYANVLKYLHTDPHVRNIRRSVVL
jgi:hypothetical protein